MALAWQWGGMEGVLIGPVRPWRWPFRLASPFQASRSPQPPNPAFERDVSTRSRGRWPRCVLSVLSSLCRGRADGGALAVAVAWRWPVAGGWWGSLGLARSTKAPCRPVGRLQAARASTPRGAMTRCAGGGLCSRGPRGLGASGLSSSSTWPRSGT